MGKKCFQIVITLFFGFILSIFVFFSCIPPNSKSGGGHGKGKKPPKTANSITVTLPNGGETWYEGGSYTAQWTSKGSITDVLIRILYYNNTTLTWDTAKEIESLNDGVQQVDLSFDFLSTLGGIPAPTLFKVSVLDKANNTIFDESDNPFSICGNQINVLSPNGGETCSEGDNVDITWSSTGVLSDNVNIKLLYWNNDTSDWSIIDLATTANTGSYSWTIPETLYMDSVLVRPIPTTYKIFISDENNVNINDVSENAFNINCINYDQYDDGGNNNTIETASNIGEVNYAGTTIVTVSGFVNPTNGDSDFYKIVMKDPVNGTKNSGTKKLHFRVKFLTNPDNAYGIKIHAGRISLIPLPVETNPNNSDDFGVGIYKQFDWGLLNLVPGQPVQSGTYETTYVIEIYKHADIIGKNLMYQVEFSNGVYTNFYLE